MCLIVVVANEAVLNFFAYLFRLDGILNNGVLNVLYSNVNFSKIFESNFIRGLFIILNFSCNEGSKNKVHVVNGGIFIFIHITCKVESVDNESFLKVAFSDAFKILSF